MALNYETGALVWAKQFTEGDVGTPIDSGEGPDFDIGAGANLFSIAGRDVVGIGSKNTFYTVLDRDTGSQIWATQVGELSPASGIGTTAAGIISSPAYVGDRIIAASNRWPMPLDVTVAALDAERGQKLWQKTLDGVAFGGVMVANGVAYLGTTNATIVALDVATGDQLWTAQNPRCRGCRSSPRARHVARAVGLSVHSGER